ncbi:polyprenyl synthetase family protein [Lentzea sp. NPDC051213]|uniref:polyprenyl synthetase family protein n=1 Tax=Lentzea sp. NPDC051213 TaxID=3364126 RepID=UPI0037A134E2
MTQALELKTLASAREIVLPALRRAAGRLGQEMRHVVGYHQGWLDVAGHDVDAAAGKALRPALALLSARAVGAPVESGIPAAVAVELVHDFSLLHDDIMDGDTERRHRPTAWTVFGLPSAILAGDGLMATAFLVLLEHDSGHGPAAAKSVADTLQCLIAGQVADLAFERRHDVSPHEYLEMAAGKTASLLGCAASLGAVIAGGAPDVVAGLGEYGRQLGIAFQLADDVLGIWGDSDVLGKPVLADLRARKKSAPVVAALAADIPAAARLAELYHGQDALEEYQLVEVAGLIEECGGRAWAERESARRLATSDRLLSRLPIEPDVRDELRATARFVVERTH